MTALTMKLLAPGIAIVLAVSPAWSPAWSQEAVPGRVRGTLAKVDGMEIVVDKQDGAKVTVHLARNAKIIAAVKASLVDVTPGTYVGISNTGPNGLQDAIEVHIFPKVMQGAGEGQTQWDLGRHSRMTNGITGTKVESYDGQDLTLTYKGGESTIQVRPNTPVVRFEVGTTADLKTGAIIFIHAGAVQPDGSITTDSVIVGRDGARPSM